MQLKLITLALMLFSTITVYAGQTTYHFINPKNCQVSAATSDLSANKYYLENHPIRIKAKQDDIFEMGEGCFGYVIYNEKGISIRADSDACFILRGASFIAEKKTIKGMHVLRCEKNCSNSTPEMIYEMGEEDYDKSAIWQQYSKSLLRSCKSKRLSSH